MSLLRCASCGYLVHVVPYGPGPKYLRKHRKGGRDFVGETCPGSHQPVRTWAPEQRQGEAS